MEKRRANWCIQNTFRDLVIGIYRMTTENKIQILAWTMFPPWIIIAASLLLEVMFHLLVYLFAWAFFGGNAFEARAVAEAVSWLGRVDVIVRVVLLVVISIAFFFAVRRLERNLPPEEHVTDQMNIGENETEPQSEDCEKHTIQ